MKLPISCNMSDIKAASSLKLNFFIYLSYYQRAILLKDLFCSINLPGLHYSAYGNCTNYHVNIVLNVYHIFRPIQFTDF